jgi:hypothetical protein
MLTSLEGLHPFSLNSNHDSFYDAKKDALAEAADRKTAAAAAAAAKSSKLTALLDKARKLDKKVAS